MSNASAHLRATTTLLACAAALTACGGGGGGSDNPNTPNAQPSSVVTGGTLDITKGDGGTLKAGSYALDTGSDKAMVYAYAYDFLGANNEIVTPNNEAIRPAVRFSTGDLTKFVVAVADKQKVLFGCRSAGWSAQEAAEIDKGLTLASAPICAGTVTIDAAAHRLHAQGLTLIDLNGGGQTITINADFNWALSTQAPVIRVENGTSGLTASSDLMSGGGTDYASKDNFTLGFGINATSKVSVALGYTWGHRDKYVLRAAAIGGATKFGCASDKWTPAELDKLRVMLAATNLPTCPAGVSFDVDTHVLKLNKAVLPAWDNSGKQLVLSLAWPWLEAPPPAQATTGVVSSGGGISSGATLTIGSGSAIGSAVVAPVEARQIESGSGSIVVRDFGPPATFIVAAPTVLTPTVELVSAPPAPVAPSP